MYVGLYIVCQLVYSVSVSFMFSAIWSNHRRRDHFQRKGLKGTHLHACSILEKKLLYSWVSYSGRRQMRLLIAITLRYNQLSLQRVVRCAGIWLRNIRKQRRRRAGTRENERNRRRGTQNRGMSTFLPLFCCDCTFN